MLKRDVVMRETLTDLIPTFLMNLTTFHQNRLQTNTPLPRQDQPMHDH